jgi:hypothetical protein
MGRLALWIMLLVAAAILFYNAAGRFIPAVGLVTIGLIHAAHMLIPNAHLSFTLPVWLVMTHAMGVGAAVHVLEDKRPRLGPRSVAGIVAGWLFWSALVIGYGALRGGIWPPGTPVWTLIWPATAVAGFLVISVWKAGAVQGAAAAEKLKRYGAMWQALYGAAWLMALGLEVQAAWLGAVAMRSPASPVGRSCIADGKHPARKNRDAQRVCVRGDLLLRCAQKESACRAGLSSRAFLRQADRRNRLP